MHKFLIKKKNDHIYNNGHEFQSTIQQFNSIFRIK